MFLHPSCANAVVVVVAECSAAVKSHDEDIFSSARLIPFGQFNRGVAARGSALTHIASLSAEYSSLWCSRSNSFNADQSSAASKLAGVNK